MISAQLDTREFNRALAEIAAESRRADVEVLTDQARRLLRKLAWLTRKAPKVVMKIVAPESGTPYIRRIRVLSGRARAGWWKAWKGLGMTGTPYIGNQRIRRDTEGAFEDGRHQLGEAYVVLSNQVSYIEKLDTEDSLMAQALQGRVSDMEAALERKHGRILRRHSA